MHRRPVRLPCACLTKLSLPARNIAKASEKFVSPSSASFAIISKIPAPLPHGYGRDLDFTNATFDGGDFTGAKFTNGKVSFGGAKFAAGQVTFRNVEFTGGEISFENAKFTGGKIFLRRHEIRRWQGLLFRR
ncbi:MAG: hypothetical protein JWM45_474 [Pseudonocardiales bacterium]|nr:hypothetical protein [Pseudonocardiales bacterium]